MCNFISLERNDAEFALIPAVTHTTLSIKSANTTDCLTERESQKKLCSREFEIEFLMFCVFFFLRVFIKRLAFCSAEILQKE